MRSAYNEIEHTSGIKPDAVVAGPADLPEGFWGRLTDNPYAHDPFRVLRWIEARAAPRKPLCPSSTPRDEPVPMPQTPSTASAPSTLPAESGTHTRRDRERQSV